MSVMHMLKLPSVRVDMTNTINTSQTSDTPAQPTKSYTSYQQVTLGKKYFKDTQRSESFQIQQYVRASKRFVDSKVIDLRRVILKLCSAVSHIGSKENVKLFCNSRF